MLYNAPWGFTCRRRTFALAATLASVANCDATRSPISCGESATSRRPKWSRSSKLGCAPTDTPWVAASSTVIDMAVGLPACIPHAMLAEETTVIRSTSHGGGCSSHSPTSAFKSMTVTPCKTETAV